MKLVRLSSLSIPEYKKIRHRQLAGTMSEMFDDENYLCFIQSEYSNWKARKPGRKPKSKEKWNDC